jgi:hypothetical protein
MNMYKTARCEDVEKTTTRMSLPLFRQPRPVTMCLYKYVVNQDLWL